MMPLSSDNTYPLNDHCVKTDGLPATNENNKVVNKFITDMTANAYLISFDHVCGKHGLGMVEFPIDNYYKIKKDKEPIRNKLYLTVYGITRPVNPIDVACEVIEPEPDIFNIPITWTYTEEDTITHFAIERKTESSDFITIADEIPASERSYTDTEVLSNTTYTYQVLAVNCAGGIGSPVAQATTPQTIPAPPSSLSEEAVTSREIHLTWTDNSHNETGFKLKRNDLADPVIIEADKTEYTDTYELLRETTYTYTICSYNELGDSPDSAEVSVTTPDPELPEEIIGVGCNIDFLYDFNGQPAMEDDTNADHWIPNTNEYSRPFAVYIYGVDEAGNRVDLPGTLTLT